MYDPPATMLAGRFEITGAVQAGQALRRCPTDTNLRQPCRRSAFIGQDQLTMIAVSLSMVL